MMRNKRFIQRWRWLLASLAAAGAGCASDDASDDDQACPLLGGSNGLHVTMSPMLDTGEYVVIARADGQVLGMGVTVIASGPTLAWRCQPESCRVEGRPFMNVASTVNIGYGDGGGPATVELELSEGGVTIARQTFTPTYELQQPNGPDCPPTLYQAYDAITVDIDGP